MSPAIRLQVQIFCPLQIHLILFVRFSVIFGTWLAIKKMFYPIDCHNYRSTIKEGKKQTNREVGAQSYGPFIRKKIARLPILFRKGGETNV